MILILEKQNIVDYIKSLRDQIRKEQNFHTGDEISKEKFLELYHQYGTDLNERVFARYVLDISYATLDNMKSGNQKTTTIFTKEKHKIEDIKQLREKIISQNNLHINDEIDYKKFMRLYNSCEHKLDVLTFASQILDIEYHNLEQLKIKPNKVCKLLRRTRFSNSEIIELRKILEEKEGIKSNTQFTYEELLEIYKQYGGILNENDFMRLVLEIPKHIHNKAKKDYKRQITLHYSVLKTEEELRKMRFEIAKQYNLHVDDKISYEQFCEIYKGYEQDFTEKSFASDVFGIKNERLDAFRKDKTLTSIFIKEKLSEQEIIQLRRKIILEENLHYEDVIDKEQFESLYYKYAGILSKKQFAEQILELTPSALTNINKNNALILKKEGTDLETIIDITNKVMKEYNLKIGDAISYESFLEIFHKYGGNMSQRQFWEDIFDVQFRRVSKLYLNTIMSSTTITNEFISNLRKEVIEENDICIKGTITKEEFEDIYLNYNHLLRKKEFARRVLDIDEASLYNLLEERNKSCTILNNEPIDYEYCRKLRKEIIEEYKLHIKDFINYQQFLEIYRKYGKPLTEKDFAFVILDITPGNLNNIKYTQNARARILMNEVILSEEITLLRNFFKQYEGNLINYQRFKELYLQYGGRMDEFTFCEQILGFKLNFIKYYKATATIKDPIAKQKAIEIRKKFSNVECRFLSEKEISTLCEQNNMTIDDFIKYVVLHYNFQFYPETLEAYKHNNGLWFGGKKIPLSDEFKKAHPEKLMEMAEIAVNKQAKLMKIPKEYCEDIKSEILLESIESYGELEKNYGHNYEELCKRIYIRMRSTAKGKISSFYKVYKSDVSRRYYFKEKEGNDIQLGETKTTKKVEDEAISNVSREKDELSNKVILAISKLSEMNISSNEIGKKLLDFLNIDKLELIKLLKNATDSNDENKNNDQRILQFSKKIIEEYKKHDVDIDYEKLVLTFYIMKFADAEINYSDIEEGILFSANMFVNHFQSWEQIRKQLYEKEINVATIAVLSDIYNEGKGISRISVQEEK